MLRTARLPPGQRAILPHSNTRPQGCAPGTATVTTRPVTFVTGKSNPRRPVYLTGFKGEASSPKRTSWVPSNWSPSTVSTVALGSMLAGSWYIWEAGRDYMVGPEADKHEPRVLGTHREGTVNRDYTKYEQKPIVIAAFAGAGIGNLSRTITQLLVLCTEVGGGITSDGESICASNAYFEACTALETDGKASWASFERFSSIAGERSNRTYVLNISDEESASATSSSAGAATTLSSSETSKTATTTTSEATTTGTTPSATEGSTTAAEASVT
ncbi:hypothetical protein VTH06DRAFT_3193 [Thermothelomyces fergusii]